MIKIKQLAWKIKTNAANWFTNQVCKRNGESEIYEGPQEGSHTVGEIERDRVQTLEIVPMWVWESER